MNASHDRSSASHAAPSAVDVLSDVLRSVRLTGSMLFLVEATTPWVSWAPPADVFRPIVLPHSQHMISYHLVTHGRCWAGLQHKPPARLETGDVLVIPHGDAYFLADPPDTEAAYGPDEAVEFFRHMAAGELPSVVAEGGGGADKAQFICGFLGCDRRPFNPVLAALPRMIRVGAAQASDRMRHLIEFALCVLREPRRTGGDSIVLRLAELMFVEVLRRHLETMADARSGWLAGLRDPHVALALGRLHAEPARAWTIDSLAQQIGTSRSVLAERFAQFVGEPPMHYLARWRIQLATRLLAEPGAKVSAVADAIGYESEAAFSRAFKRAVGVAPTQWRTIGATGQRAANTQ